MAAPPAARPDRPSLLLWTTLMPCSPSMPSRRELNLAPGLNHVSVMHATSKSRELKASISASVLGKSQRALVSNRLAQYSEGTIFIRLSLSELSSSSRSSSYAPSTWEIVTPHLALLSYTGLLAGAAHLGLLPLCTILGSVEACARVGFAAGGGRARVSVGGRRSLSRRPRIILVASLLWLAAFSSRMDAYRSSLAIPGVARVQPISGRRGLSWQF